MSEAEAEAGSMLSVVASLSKSFDQVPPSAVPAVLDCILLSTGLSPPSLFASLLHDFPRFLKDIIKEDGTLDSDKRHRLVSLVAAFCHLLKKTGADSDAIQLFVWRCFLPLAKVLPPSQHDLLNQITESLMDVVIKTGTLEVLEETLVPVFIRSVGLSLGMLHNDDSSLYKWSRESSHQDSHDVVDGEQFTSSSNCYKLTTSCNVLSVILELALQFLHTNTLSNSAEREGCIAETFVKVLILELCSMSERMLLHSPEHRSCAIGFLLPIILKTFHDIGSFEISIHGQKHGLSREHFFMKIWNCCKTLFSMGPLERREGYNTLSLYFSFSWLAEEYEISDSDTVIKAEEFDIRAEKEFWDEIKTGLVDRESLVRKQSLHILKMALNIREGVNSLPSISNSDTNGKCSVPCGVTRKELWALKEAKSLGVGKLSTLDELIYNSQQYWGAFVLLYEMLEEYGTHLVEAAWNHQVSLMLQFSESYLNVATNISKFHQDQFEVCGEPFDWLSILWERGLQHDNPQVRCLIMQSFLDINLENHVNYVKSVPETFVLGPFMQGLNDPMHHKEFGVKGVYTSTVIKGAAQFFRQYVNFLSPRKLFAFLYNLASTTKHQSFGRAGLMGLAECIASASAGIGILIHARTESFTENLPVEFFPGMEKSQTGKKELLDIFRYVIESSKQHFNPSYRLQVCGRILEAAASVVCAFDIPLETLLFFISALPHEFTDYGGKLRSTVQRWFSGCGYKDCCANCCLDDMKLCKSLYDFPHSFISNHRSIDISLNYDDGDFSAWEFEANRWARVLFLAITEEHPLEPILMFIQKIGSNIFKQNHDAVYIRVKFLILASSFVLELRRTTERVIEYGNKARTKNTESGFPGVVDDWSFIDGISKKLVDIFLYLLDDLVQFATQSCSVFWSGAVAEDTALPGAVRGKLGGPSQRRLPISATTAVLQAMMSVKAMSLILLWCKQIKKDALLSSAFTFMWQFFWRTARSPHSFSETQAEVCLAAYESLVPVLKVLASTYCIQSFNLIEENEQLFSDIEGRPQLDCMCGSFIQNINDLLGAGILARSRRAVLLDIKWACLESLLSIPSHALKNGIHLEENHTFFSDDTLRCIFGDLVESLENAGESSVLSMLRSLRMLFELVAKVTPSAVVSCSHVIDAQVIWNLVHSSWILHINCNKRRVASIAALLSSVLHPLLFNDESMHQRDNAPGPLKWFIENLLEEGTKSPRTIRLAALHLTGLWLLNPIIIKFYLKELKLLSLYGSVAFDEDFEGELADNNDARLEVSLLARSPDPELTEAFINTELYARVSVAVLFYKLADLACMVESPNEDVDCMAALDSGRSFLLELLDSAVNDKDLAKELYKKYSSIHRHCPSDNWLIPKCCITMSWKIIKHCMKINLLILKNTMDLSMLTSYPAMRYLQAAAGHTSTAWDTQATSCQSPVGGLSHPSVLSKPNPDTVNSTLAFSTAVTGTIQASAAQGDGSRRPPSSDGSRNTLPRVKSELPKPIKQYNMDSLASASEKISACAVSAAPVNLKSELSSRPLSQDNDRGNCTANTLSSNNINGHSFNSGPEEAVPATNEVIRNLSSEFSSINIGRSTSIENYGMTKPSSQATDHVLTKSPQIWHEPPTRTTSWMLRLLPAVLQSQNQKSKGKILIWHQSVPSMTYRKFLLEIHL